MAVAPHGTGVAFFLQGSADDLRRQLGVTGAGLEKDQDFQTHLPPVGSAPLPLPSHYNRASVHAVKHAGAYKQGIDPVLFVR